MCAPPITAALIILLGWRSTLLLYGLVGIPLVLTILWQSSILHEQTRRPVENPVARVLREGVVIGLGNHTVLRARDGKERPIDDSAAPIRGADGETVGVVLTFRDVT